MPELPEVETVRSGLAATYVGKELERLTVSGTRTVRRHPEDLLRRLDGRRLAEVGRHGKFLLLRWDGDEVLVAHLRMSGQLLAALPGDPLQAHTHAVFCFHGAGELRFVDPRTFGELFLLGSDGLGLGHLGPDALGLGAAALRAHLARELAGRRAPLKALLVDQRVLAGIGNIYADEIAFSARLRPDRPGGSLKPREVARLAVSVSAVLSAAVAARGSTLADRRYRDVWGEAGRYQLEHKVYGRNGMPCATCAVPVQRLALGARSAYFCPRCQA